MRANGSLKSTRQPAQRSGVAKLKPIGSLKLRFQTAATPHHPPKQARPTMPQHIHRLHQGMLIIQHTPSNHPQRTLVPDHRTGQPFAPDELYAVAERINPKRAYLFVSKILSRHIPQPINHPTIAAAYQSLAQALSQYLARIAPPNATAPSRILMISMAETATQIGLKILEQLRPQPHQHITHIASTRETALFPSPAHIWAQFEESHSHHTRHYLPDPALQQIDALVFIDDEYSTGNTLKSSLKSILARHPQCFSHPSPKHIITLSFLDWREQIGELRQIAEQYAPHSTWTEHAFSLAQGRFDFQAADNCADVASLDHAQSWLHDAAPLSERFQTEQLALHRQTASAEYAQHIRAHQAQIAQRLNPQNWGDSHAWRKILVLACGENHYHSELAARALQHHAPHVQIWLGSITRSPILCQPRTDYPIRHKAEIDTPQGSRFVYNLPPDHDYDAVFIVPYATNAQGIYSHGLINHIPRLFSLI